MTRRLLLVLGTPDAGRTQALPLLPAPAGAPLQRIPVESPGVAHYVPVDAIDYITAAGPHAQLHVGGATHLVREGMQALEQRLDPARFLRIHRSAIVQLDRVESLEPRGRGEAGVRLRDGTALPVSRRRRQLLEQRLAAPVEA